MKNVVLIRSNAVAPDPPVEKMANTLLKLGYCVQIVGWDRNENYLQKTEKISFKNGNVNIIRFGIKAAFGSGLKGNFKPLFLFQIRLSRWLKENIKYIDIIHSFDFDTAFISKIYAKKYEVKYVYHILDYYADSHNLGKGFLRGIIERLENQVIAKADATIICTEKRKEQISRSKPQKLYIIHNTPDKQSVDTNLSISKSLNEGKMKIVYVGILAQSRMLKEIAEIVSEDEKYELHIGGFGQLEEYFEKASGKYSNIFYYGKVPYSNTLALEMESDVMVAIYDPTIRNNKYAAPNKFYESLMLGKPLIMAKGTGVDQIIDENDIGMTVEFSKKGVLNGLQYLYDNRSRWEEMSIREKKLYDEEYSWTIMEKRIENIYNSL